jgi:hypothetical protein
VHVARVVGGGRVVERARVEVEEALIGRDDARP